MGDMSKARRDEENEAYVVIWYVKLLWSTTMRMWKPQRRHRELYLILASEHTGVHSLKDRLVLGQYDQPASLELVTLMVRSE